jgi:hypothetical protein
MTSIMSHNNIVACDKFAAANGWKASDRVISLELLASGKKHDGGRTYSHPLHFDHAEYFRKDGWPVAVMAHNYPGQIEQLRNWFAAETLRADDDDHKLVLHEPYQGMGLSWYYPFHSLPMCVTRCDVKSIVWPSDEDAARYAVAYFEERERERKVRQQQPCTISEQRDAIRGGGQKDVADIRQTSSLTVITALLSPKFSHRLAMRGTSLNLIRSTSPK